MILKCLVPMVMGAALLAGTAAMADEYRPGEFLTLDLPTAVLSPRPLGPEAHFEPVPVEASSDQTAAIVAPAAQPDVPRSVAAARVHLARPMAAARGTARIRLAHRRGNPLDAQAMDIRTKPQIRTHIQTWPCKPGSGGICAWK